MRNPRLFLVAFFWLGLFRLALLSLSYPRVLGLQRRSMRGKLPDNSDPLGTSARVERALQRVQPWVPGARCLAMALAGQVMIQRRGVLTELKLGVAPEQSGIAAHAWLELEGQTVFGAQEEKEYAVLREQRERQP